MKDVKLIICGSKINIDTDSAGVTVPEMYRIVRGLIHNLTNVYPKPELVIDEHEKMSVVYNEPVRDNPNLPAIITMQLKDGFPAGGDVQNNGQTGEAVLRALKYLQHIYANKILEIATLLLGPDEKLQESWIERVINENKI